MSNMWTLALASAEVIGLGTTAVKPKEHALMTSLSQTTISGYVDTSAIWSPGSPNGFLHGAPSMAHRTSSTASICMPLSSVWRSRSTRPMVCRLYG